MASTLAELWVARGHDARLIAECLARGPQTSAQPKPALDEVLPEAALGREG